MAAHRYWRLNINAIKNAALADAPTPFVASLELRASSGGANLAVAGNGAASATSFEGVGWEADKAFDGLANTSWYGSSATWLGYWLKWDFGDANDQDIAHVSILNSGTYDAAVYGATVEYSDDNTNWTVLMSFGSRTTALGGSSTHIYTPPGFATADLTLPMLDLAADAGATTELPLPGLTLASNFGATADSLALPGLVILADLGAVANLTLPMLALEARGHDSTGENSFEGVLPMLALAADFGVAADHLVLPGMTLDAGITGVALISVGLTLPMLTLDAAGVGSPYVIGADIVMPLAMVESNFGAGVQMGLPKLTLDASITAGGLLTATITIPMVAVGIDVRQESYGSIILALPVLIPSSAITADLTIPLLQLDGRITAVVTATYEAYAVNLQHRDPEAHDEVTHYTNFPFTHVVRYRNSYYGVAAAGGLYLLEGTTDDAEPIPYAVKTGLDELGTASMKNVASAYFAGRLGPDMTVTLYAGEDGQTSYDYNTAQVAQARTHREKFGRGVVDRYFALGVSGSGALELAGVELEVNQLKRKI